MNKIKDFLYDNKIMFEWSEDKHGCKTLWFTHNDKRINVMEYMGNNGNTIKGMLVTNIRDGYGLIDFSSQKKVIEYLEVYLTKGV